MHTCINALLILTPTKRNHNPNLTLTLPLPNSNPTKPNPENAVSLSLCAKIGSRVWTVAHLLQNIKTNKKTRGFSTAHRIRTKFGRAGDFPNVITQAKFQID